MLYTPPMIRLLLSLLIVALAPGLAVLPGAKAALPVASARADVAADLRTAFQAAFDGSGPGAAVIVVKDGKVLLRDARGLANVELGVPLAPDSVFRIGSVTKQFTAAAILMLVQEGKLAVGDPITKYLPDYPVQGRTITVEHLLTHTSGIKSYTGMLAWRGIIPLDKNVREMIDIFKDQPMEFEPGERWAYNNSGYFLLGAIIEKVSGKSYESFVKERIFEPLQMKQSYYDRPGPIIPKRAAGYSRLGTSAQNAEYLSMTQPYSAGALASTVDDLAKWDAALYGDSPLTAASRAQMFKPYALKAGESAHYGYGWMIGRYRDTAVVEHGGGINGFTCHVVRMPDARVYVALLTNAGGGASPQSHARRLATIALGQPLAATDTLPSEPVLEQYVGRYHSDGPPPVVREVTRQGARLSMQRPGAPPSELVALAPDTFYARESLALVTFQRDASGKVTAVAVDNWGRVEKGQRR